MTLRPRSVPQSVRLKHPDGLEGASKLPLRGIRAHSATSPKRPEVPQPLLAEEASGSRRLAAAAR